jgi:translation initiation factor IF-2
MNNGKVRIYELSKELNLENKDIKDICEQLNITVKSHSSTITDSQAERVRAIASKYTPETTAKNNLKDRQNPQNKSKKKPQILAIHHRNNSSEATTTPTLAGPPKLPTKAPSNLQNKASVSPKITAQTPSSSSIVTESTTIESPNEEAIASSRQLVSPPSRPQLNKTASKSNKVVQINKKTEIKSKSSETKATEGKSSEKNGLASPKKNKTLAAPSLPKLQKPPKLSSSEPELESVPDETEEKEDVAVVDGDELDLDLDKRKAKKDKLKRPNPPRKLKEKTWEDEEEDVLEQKAKSATKGKRRPKPIMDDDEDEFGNTFEVSAATTAIGLSIARPPKPKSTEAPAQKPAATTKNKPKRSSSKADKASKAERRNRKTVEETPEIIEATSSLTVRELADLLKVPETDIIRNLFFKGMAVNITQTLDLDTVRLVAEELGVVVDTPEAKSAATKETEMLNAEDLENLELRPPVVTIMGHVDHGKTTLLDSIRKSKVAQGEAGGITQHIGAYHVDIEHEGKEQQIVFLDTPGHEAFTAMRARGTRVTDIAILVVAADDGVQPQTKEAISHARAAEVPLIVAINKVDKPEANPDRIKQELAEQGLVSEAWGGDTTMVEVSALKGDNLDELLEMIVLVAEIEELSANPNRPAKGTVIEAHLDRTRGPVATLLVQNGTLRVGDSIVAGSVFGKIRAMIDDRGDKVEAATPSFAVEILGLGEVPEAGDEFDVYLNEKDARAIAEANSEKQRDSRLQQTMSSRRVSLSSLSAQAQEGELKELNLILKADVQGSVEAILGSLQQLPQNEVQIRVLLASPGEVTETDVDLAAASGAVIIGFNTTLASGSRQAADNEGVDIRQYNIIYKLLDDIQGAMEGLLDPEEVEEPLGQAEVRAVFAVGRGAVAGCYIQSGKIIRNCKMRVRRNNKVIYEGNLDSLKRMKEDAREVNAGYECGIGSNKFNDWQESDLIEAYEMTFKRRTLSGSK